MVLGDNLWSWTVLVSTVLVMQHKLILLVHSHRLGRRECHLWFWIYWCYKHTWLMEVMCPNPFDLKLRTWQLSA